MKFIAILGRQPQIGMAELERLYGSDSTRWFSDTSAIVETESFNFNRLGGILKAGRVVAELRNDSWHTVSQQIVKHYLTAWKDASVKITLGISVYGFNNLSTRDVQKTGIILKKKLRERDISLRLIPNAEPELNTATSHHNKLGLSDNKVELIITRSSSGAVIIAESIGAQNITALAARDQGRPKRDAFVGMLPPKLAMTMVNLAAGQVVDSRWNMVDGKSKQQEADTNLPNTTYQIPPTILDPFCGTGVILQEALLMGYDVFGSDLSDKMVDYSRANLEWLTSKFQIPNSKFDLEQGDATTHQWQSPINAVATEAYLGQPFSAPPSDTKLREVRGNCDNIIRTFLKNIAGQIPSGTPLCVAVPAWKDTVGQFTHLPLTRDLETLGFKLFQFSNVNPKDLLYHREDQVVARELLVISKI